MPKPESFKNHAEFVRWNEEMSRTYDTEAYHLRASAVIRWIERRRVRAVRDFLGSRPTDTVLEVGCGAGMVLSQFTAARLVGIDLSGYILHEKTRHRLVGRKAFLAQADAEELPFRNCVFSRIVCTEVMEHVRNPVRLVLELARVAVSDATVVLSIPNEPLIERLKALVGRLGLGRRILGGETPRGGEGGMAYDSPTGTNEWHLHSFDLGLFREVVNGVLVILAVRPIPSRFLPLRWVVRCRPVLGMTTGGPLPTQDQPELDVQ